MSGGTVIRDAGLLFLVFCFSIVGLNGQSPCNRVSNCACRGDDFGIDLTTLTIGSRLFNTTSDNSTYIYKPCSGFIYGNASSNNTCNVDGGVAVCLVVPDDNPKGLGLPNADFVFDASSGMYTVEYHQEQITTVIQLHCDKVEGSIALGTGSNETFYNLTLTSSSCCIKKDEPHKKDGPSPGTVILILIAVAFLVYFVGGIIYMKFIQGAQGWEIIPNLEFWLDLPLLMKDGFIFLISGCKSPLAYDRI